MVGKTKKKVTSDKVKSVDIPKDKTKNTSRNIVDKDILHHNDSKDTSKDVNKYMIHHKFSEILSDKNLTKREKVHHIKEKVKHNFRSLPRGMRVLLQFNGILALAYFFLIFFLDKTILFGFVVEGFFARLIHFTFFVALLYSIFGISYRKRFAYYLMMGLYVLAVLNSFLSIFFISKINDIALLSIREIFIPCLIVLILVNGLCLWYMYHKHNYFISEDKEEAYKESKFDRIFVKLIYGLYGFVILVFVIFAVVFFTMTIPTLNPILNDISSMDIGEALAYCERSDIIGTKKDLCYMSVAIMNPEEQHLDMLCKRIDNNFYQFTCYNRFKS